MWFVVMVMAVVMMRVVRHWMCLLWSRGSTSVSVFVRLSDSLGITYSRTNCSTSRVRLSVTDMSPISTESLWRDSAYICVDADSDNIALVR